MTQNTELLTIGGGAVSLKDTFDSGSFYRIGNCPSFNILVSVEKKFDESYFADSNGNLIKLKTTAGKIIGATLGGDFIVEELTRDFIQNKWFYGAATSAGTEALSGGLSAPVRAVRIKTDPINGISECITFPAIDLSCTGSVSGINTNEFKSLSFEFKILYDLGINTSPIARVQEPGETLVDFCV